MNLILGCQNTPAKQKINPFCLWLEPLTFTTEEIEYLSPETKEPILSQNDMIESECMIDIE